MITSSNSLAEQIADARRRAEALVKGLTAEQMIRRPQPEKWSIAECLAHLNVTATTMQGLMQRAIERGREEKKFRQGPFSLGIKGRLLIWIAEPPPKFRISAPRGMRPPVSTGDPLQVLQTFLQKQDEWERLMRDQDGLDLDRVTTGKWNSLFGIRLCAAVPWMLAHQRRHLVQAEKARKQICNEA